MGFSRVDLGHYACELVSSDCRWRFSKMGWIKVISLNLPFLATLGHFESLFLLIKHKQELLHYQTSWFHKYIRGIQPKMLVDVNLVTRQKCNFWIFWPLFWPVTPQTSTFLASAMLFFILISVSTNFFGKCLKNIIDGTRYFLKNVILAILRSN